MLVMKFGALPPRGSELYVPPQNHILAGETVIEAKHYCNASFDCGRDFNGS